MKEKSWVDFKAIKDAVDIRMVLNHYGITNLSKSGDELRGPCPIHKGSSRSRNFSVSTRKNAFKCFANECGARGNVLDLVAAIEGCSVRDAALKLREWFKVGETETSSPEKVEEDNLATEVQRGIYRDKDGGLYEVVIPVAIAEDLEAVVVYRKLFEDYAYRIATPENFVTDDLAAEPGFTLVKEL